MSRFRFLPHVISLVIFSSVLLSTWMVYEHKNEEDKLERYRSVLNNLNQVSNRLQDTLKNNALIAESFAAILKAKSYQINAEEFNIIARELMVTRDELRSIQLAPGAITEFIYPAEQNINLSRLNLFRQGDKQTFLNTINRHEIFLTGPDAMIQGGRGFAIRKPLYKINNSGELWGVVSVVIDLKSILEKSGLFNRHGEIHYAIRKIDKEAKDVYLAGKRILFELDSIVKHIELFNLQLDIAAFPRLGWYEEGWQQYVILLVGIIAALFISSLSFLLMKSPVSLKQRINESSLELKNKSHELKIEKQWHESLLDTTPDLIYYKDINGIYIACNQAFADYLGFDKDDIIGKKDEALIPNEIGGFFHLLDKSYLENPEYQHNEEWIETSHGKTLTLDTIKMPVFDDNDKLLGIFGISRDNSELGHPVMENEICSSNGRKNFKTQ